MTISEIYKKYNTIPHLQLHMLRVAGVGVLICDNFKNKIDKNTVITACLLHDIGNNAKQILDFWNEEIDGKDINYWKGIKELFTQKYGEDADAANIKIAQELGTSKKIVEIISGMGHLNTAKIFTSVNYELKITDYANWRVLPKKISSLEKRVTDWLERYKTDLPNNETYAGQILRQLKGIEKQIFDQCKVKPEYITEERVDAITVKLRSFEIPLNP